MLSPNRLGFFFFASVTIVGFVVADEKVERSGKEYIPPKSTKDLGKCVIENADELITLRVGQVVVGFSNHFECKIENRTGKSLEISDLRTSCGCLLATPENKYLGTSEATKLFFVVSPAAIGTLEKSISISAKSANSNPVNIQIKLTGVAKDLYTSNVQELHIGQGPAEFELKLTKNFPTLPDYELAADNNFKVSNVKVKGAVVTYRFKDDLWSWKDGEFARTMNLQLQHNRQVGQSIKIKISNPNGWQIIPTRAVSRNTGSETQKTFRFFIKASKKRIESIRDPGDIVVEVNGGRLCGSNLRKVSQELIALEIACEYDDSLDEAKADFRWKSDNQVIGKVTLILE